MRKIISLIAAVSENGVIGKDGKLPWHIPEDLKYFRDKTKGHPIIMGRATFDSIGGKPLPGRQNLVITRNGDFSAPGVEIAHTIDEAIDKALPPPDGEVFVVGGSMIYLLAMPKAHRIYLTRIHQSVDGDSFFPEFDPSLFRETSRADRPGPPPFTFVVYERNGF